MTDQAIIALFWQRSEDAIRSTAQQYGAYLTKIAMNILGQPEESEECVNDTYLTAWNQIPPDRPQTLFSYLGRITRCLALNRFDYLTAGKRNGGITQQLSELEDCLSGPDFVQERYEEAALASVISAFLRKQTPEARNIFIRRYWFSDSIGDIAARFHISESKTKSILFRTRNRLRKHLETEGYHI